MGRDAASGAGDGFGPSADGVGRRADRERPAGERAADGTRSPPGGRTPRTGRVDPVRGCGRLDRVRFDCLNLDSSVECLTQRRREAKSAENARNLANTMSYASNLLEAKHHLKGETTMRKNSPPTAVFRIISGKFLVITQRFYMLV